MVRLARRARSCHGSARPASPANSPWTIPNPVPSHNHASSSKVSVTQSSVEQVTVNLTPTASAMRRNRVPLEETGFRWKNHAYTNGYFASKIVKTLKSRYGSKRVRIADSGPSLFPKDLNPKAGMTVYRIRGKR
ncbi:hypothetical protein F2Q70_00038293 [Brassica cretica]|uniref:Uncharacterized protein n=1 Tax=Brassica cretica TaxID=69181 RepID=A0A8S9KDJ2_BRACR|nr:hypothetical protein F2Q70_00038293 [Brassica cretica]